MAERRHGLDQDLRELERAVHVKGDAPSRIRLARALERLGRRDEIPGVLRPVIADGDARRVLCELPAWRSLDGEPGRTRFIDAPPLRSPPRVRQVRRADGSFVTGLLANEVALILTLQSSGGVRRALVIDPSEGNERPGERWSFDAEVSSIGMTGDRALFLNDARDLWTGAHVPSSTEERVSAGCYSAALLSPNYNYAAVARTWIVASAPREVIAFDRTRAVLWRLATAATHPVVLADEEGALIRRDDEPSSPVELVARSGKVLWASNSGASPVALGPGAVTVLLRIGRRGDKGQLAVLDRLSGVPRAMLTPPFPVWDTPERIVCARDVVFYAAQSENAVVAVTLRGDVLWRASLEEKRDDRIRFLAPAAERLYAATLGGAVYELCAGG